MYLKKETTRKRWGRDSIVGVEFAWVNSLAGLGGIGPDPITSKQVEELNNQAIFSKHIPIIVKSWNSSLGANVF